MAGQSRCAGHPHGMHQGIAERFDLERDPRVPRSPARIPWSKSYNYQNIMNLVGLEGHAGYCIIILAGFGERYQCAG